MTEPNDIAATLNDLERQVFEAVRGLGEVRVREISEALANNGRPLAYTTVMTVLVRLWEKGYLLRKRDGRAYCYQVRSSEQIAGTIGGRAVRDAITRFGEHAIVGFVQELTPEQRDAILRLLQGVGGDDAQA